MSTALEAPTRLKCSETRKDGQPCGAPPVRDGKCAGHAGLGIAADPRANQARSAAARREQAELRQEAKKLGLTDVLALKLARDAEQIAENWVLEASKDYRAAEMALTRLFGKPKETLEVSGGLDLTALTGQERAELVRRALEASPDVLEALPAVYQARLTPGSSGI